jgi:hypothetical protein
MATSLSTAHRTVPFAGFLSKDIVGRLLVALLAAIIYLPSFGPVAVWDDDVLLSGQAIGGGKSFLACFTHVFLVNYYRPIVSASFYLDRKLFGAGPVFNHQTNILIHVLTAVALVCALQAAFRSRRIGILGGLLFAVQPVQISTVAWIGGRTDSLCALWVVLFAWAIVRAAQTEGRERAIRLALATAMYALAILTKEQVLPIILLVPLAFRCWSPERGRDLLRTSLRASVPFMACVVVFGGLYIIFGPKGVKMTHDSFGYILMAFARTVCYYTLLLFVPTARWIHTFSLGAFVPMGGWCLLVAGALLGAFGYLFVRGLRSAPAVSWFMALTVLSLALVSNLIPVPSMLVCPYRAGVAGIGAAALMAWMLDRLLVAAAEAKHSRRFALSARAAVAAAGVMTWWTVLCGWGVFQWQDELAIVRQFVRQDPSSVWSHTNLAAALMKAHQPKLARAEMEGILRHLFGSNAWERPETAKDAIAHQPRILAALHEVQGTAMTPREWLAGFYARLGYADLALQDPNAAQLAFRTGLTMDRENAAANGGLGIWYYQHDMNHKAIAYLRLAASIDTDNEAMHMVLAQACYAAREITAAQEEYARCLKLAPWSQAPYMQMSTVETSLGDYAAARSYLVAARKTAYCNEADITRQLHEVDLAERAHAKSVHAKYTI